jgi:hypothetical protein
MENEMVIGYGIYRGEEKCMPSFGVKRRRPHSRYRRRREDIEMGLEEMLWVFLDFSG